MSPFKTAALSVSAILISIVSVQAAPHHMKKPAHHMAAHSMSHHAGRGMAPRASVANADHSADSLNAQSLTRSQGATQ